MGVSLDKAREGYALANRVEQKSPRTVEWYDCMLRQFIAWLRKERGSDDADLVDRQVLRTYIQYLQSERVLNEGHRYRKTKTGKLSPCTVRANYTTLHAFFNWLVREELLSSSPMTNMTKPRMPKYIEQPYSQDEVAAMLKATESLPKVDAALYKALLLFLLDTGARASEVCGLLMANLDLEHGRAKVMGKGAKERFLYLGKATSKALWQWTSLYRAKPVGAVDNVFLTSEGRPLRTDRLDKIVKRVAALAGVSGAHVHRWRRTAAVQFLRGPGSSVLSLQRMLGHESLEMVRHYCELAEQDLEKAHRTASPVDNWALR